MSVPFCPCAMMPDEPFMAAQRETQEKGWCNYSHYAEPSHYEKCPFNKKQTKTPRVVLEKKICAHCNRELVRLSGEEYYIVSIIGDRTCSHEWKDETVKEATTK